MNFKIQIPKSKFQSQGFTLIEILVTVAVLGLILVIISGLFTAALRAQRKTLAFQELLAQTSYVMEYMSRQLRMAQKQSDDQEVSCLSQNGLNYEKINLPEKKGIKFINYRGECWEFFRDQTTKRLKQSKAGVEEFLTSTSLDLEVENFEVELIGASEADTLQPRVVFFLEAQRKSERPEAQPVIKIQTTISQRNHDFK